MQGVTPIVSNPTNPRSEEEKEGLVQETYRTQLEFNEAGHANIKEAIHWTRAKKFKECDILAEAYIDSSESSYRYLEGPLVSTSPMLCSDEAIMVKTIANGSSESCRSKMQRLYSSAHHLKV